MIDRIDEEVIGHMYNVASEMVGKDIHQNEEYYKEYDDLDKTLKIIIKQYIEIEAVEQLNYFYGGGHFTESDFTHRLANRFAKNEDLMEVISK